MRFTQSKDGVPRTDLRVTARLALDDIAWTLVNEVYDDDDPYQSLRQISKAKVVKLMREYVMMHGPPPAWPRTTGQRRLHVVPACSHAYADRDNELIDVAVRRVKELWNLR